MQTRDLLNLLRAKYAPEAFAFFTEVANGTGGHCSRHADAMVMGLWPSRGLHLQGFELKASRADWLRELQNPAKADAIANYCDYWWVVVAKAAFVADGELPKTWGMMAADSGKLKIIVDAPKLEPKPVSRAFLAAICRKASEQSVDRDAIEKAARDGRAQGVAEAKAMTASAKREHERLAERVRLFEEAAGIEIDTWKPAAEIGKAVRLILQGSRPMDAIMGIRNAAQRVVDDIDKAISGNGDSAVKFPKKVTNAT